ncbi:MAG: type II secretion system protein [Phycisphaerales bacterium]
MNRTPRLNTPARRTARRGFSLMELLVVILIIALVMAILIPSIAGARRAAKNVSSTAMLQSLSTACGQFITDNGRSPGYFSPGDMGSVDNETRGLSGMQNIMLDLMGGVVDAGSGASFRTVGPRNTGSVIVDLVQIGATTGGSSAKSYFNPDRSFYDVDQSRRPIGQVGNNENTALPSLVDSFGMPILAWTQDDRAGTAFGARNSATSVAKFYWASNACFLKSGALGPRGAGQLWNGVGSAASMLGDGVGDMAIAGTLEALLGDPTAPAKDYTDANRKAGNARGQVVFHSAGPDGYYLGALDVGGKAAGGTSNTVLYTRDTDTVRPPFFDDVIVTSGK